MHEHDVTIRLGTAADTPAIAALTQRMYAIKRSERFFEWYFFDEAMDSRLYCAYANDSLVGMLGIHSRRLSNNLLCGQIVGINVAPEAAGKGVFSAMCRHVGNVLSTHDILCVFANDNAVKPCQRSLGMTFEDMPTFVRELSKPVECKVLYTVMDIEPETRFTHSEEDNEIITFRHSLQFHQWRYGRHPSYRYSIVKLDCGDYAIIKIFTDHITGISYGDIVDLECPLTDADRIENLLNSVCHYFVNKDVCTVTMWATPASVLYTTVLKIGFNKGKTKSNFGITILNNSINSRVLSLENWFVCQADATNY